MHSEALTREIGTGVLSRGTLPTLADIPMLRRGGSDNVLSDKALGVATSLALHVALGVWALYSGALTSWDRPLPLRVSFVEFVPVDVTSAAPAPAVRQEALAVKTAVTRSVEKPKKRELATVTTPTEAVTATETKSAPSPTETGPASALAPDTALAGNFTASGAGVDGAMNVGPLRVGYESAILSRLERVKRYPQRAIQRHLEGDVMLTLRLSANGEVLHSAISRTSGHEFFDAEVLKMVERATPFPAAPAGLTRAAIDFLVPVTFRLN
jgi:TonB family protein